MLTTSPSRVLCGAFIVLVSSGIPALAAPSLYVGFNTNEDGSDYALGGFDGTGTAVNGWGGAWTVGTGEFKVVAGGAEGDQSVFFSKAGSTQYANRDVATPWTGLDNFSLRVSLWIDQTGWGWANPAEMMFREADGDRNLHIKIEANGWLRVNDDWLINLTNPVDMTGLVMPVGAGNWASLQVEYDAATTTYTVYWENTSGGMTQIGSVIHHRDGGYADGQIVNIKWGAPKLNNVADQGTVGIGWDGLTVGAGAPPAECNTVIGLTTGEEIVTVYEGTSPADIVYALINGGASSHDYEVDEMAVVAPAVADLFNTGVDGSGDPLGDQMLDPHYTLTVNPDSAATETYTSLSDGFPIPPWIANNSTSRWITVRPDDGDSLGSPGSYTYQTTFTAPGSDTSVLGRLAVDDSLADILVGGVSTGLDADQSFPAWQPFQLDIGAADTSVSFVVTNGSTSENPTGLRVEFFDRAAADVSWLSVSPANPITVASGVSTDVTASINTTGLAPGEYRAFLKFSNLDDCDPPNEVSEDPIVRQIELTVTNWEVTPAEAQSRYFVSLGSSCDNQTPEDVQFTVTNVGATTEVTYTVAKSGDCDWLTLDKTGPIVVTPGNSDVVTGTINPTGLSNGDHTCQVVFTNVDTGLPLESRSVTLSVLGAVWEYNGDVDPTAPDSAGTGFSFVVEEGVNQGVVENDASTKDGKVLRLTDTSSAKTKYRSDNTVIMGEVGATIVTRMKVYSYGPNTTKGLAFGVWDDLTGDSAGYFYSGDEGSGLGTVEELNRDVANATVPGDNAFHVLRMTVAGTESANRTIELYFDEDPTPVVSIPFADSSTDAVDGFLFGAGSTAGEIDVAFDWLTATNAGAFAPGEELNCLGRSLVIGVCPLPFADMDQDGDVDQDDFGVFQLCYTGEGGTIESDRCGCFDRDGDGDISGNDYDHFMLCSTGPAVPFDVENPPPNCIP